MGMGVTCNRSSLCGGEEETKGELMMLEYNLTLSSCLWKQVVVAMWHEQNLNIRDCLSFDSYKYVSLSFVANNL